MYLHSASYKNSIAQVIFFGIVHGQLLVQIIDTCIHVNVTFRSFLKLINTANLIESSFHELVSCSKHD